MEVVVHAPCSAFTPSKSFSPMSLHVIESVSSIDWIGIGQGDWARIGESLLATYQRSYEIGSKCGTDTRLLISCDKRDNTIRQTIVMKKGFDWQRSTTRVRGTLGVPGIVLREGRLVSPDHGELDPFY